MGNHGKTKDQGHSEALPPAPSHATPDLPRDAAAPSIIQPRKRASGWSMLL